MLARRKSDQHIYEALECVRKIAAGDFETRIHNITDTGPLGELLHTINDLVDQALSEKDHATNVFLQWFITEQIEEEATVSDILGRLKLFGDQGQGLLLIDNELAQLAQGMNTTIDAATAGA